MAGWRAIRFMALVGLVVGAPGFAQAQARSSVGVVTTLVGEATVARAEAQPQSLRVRDHVLFLDRISTKERSMVHVLMGGKALLTVRELSVVTVTEEGGRATVDLQSGKIGLAVVRERMKPGETIEVQTPHAVAAVRGTVLVVEIVPPPTGANQPDGGESSTNVHLLHGKLDVSLRSNPGGGLVKLESLQTVTATRTVLGTMRPLDPAAATAATTGLRPREQAATPIPDKLQTAVGERQGALALATAAELVRGGQSRDSVKGRGGKAEATALVKAGDGGSTREAFGTAGRVGDGVGAVLGSAFGSINGAVTSLGNSGSSGSSGGSGSGSGGGGGLATTLGTTGTTLGTTGTVLGTTGSALGNTVGGILGGSGGSNSGKGNSGPGGGPGTVGNSGPGSLSGGGKGPSLGSGSGGLVGTVLAPVTNLPLVKKK